MDDETEKALLEELRALRAEVAELKATPPPIPEAPRAYRLTDDAMARSFVNEFEVPMRLAGLDPNKRPDLANIFANIPKE